MDWERLMFAVIFIDVAVGSLLCFLVLGALLLRLLIGGC